jgi:hypothetical protein
MTTKIRLTALALVAAALTTASLTAAEARMLSHGATGPRLPVTLSCAGGNCAPPTPPTVWHGGGGGGGTRGPTGGIHDPGSPSAGEGAGSAGGYNCVGDRDCGIFRQD